MLLQPRFDLTESEAQTAAELETGDRARFEPIHNRPGAEAKQIGTLAGGEQRLGHAAASTSSE
jgi:hypothetical protein